MAEKLLYSRCNVQAGQYFCPYSAFTKLPTSVWMQLEIKGRFNVKPDLIDSLRHFSNRQQALWYFGWLFQMHFGYKTLFFSNAIKT